VKSDGSPDYDAFYADLEAIGEEHPSGIGTRDEIYNFDDSDLAGSLPA